MSTTTTATTTVGDISKNDRDRRFKAVVRQQLGETGLTLLIGQSFACMLAVLILCFLFVAFVFHKEKDGGDGAARSPAVEALKNRVALL